MPTRIHFPHIQHGIYVPYLCSYFSFINFYCMNFSPGLLQNIFHVIYMLSHSQWKMKGWRVLIFFSCNIILTLVKLRLNIDANKQTEKWRNDSRKRKNDREIMKGNKTIRYEKLTCSIGWWRVSWSTNLHPTQMELLCKWMINWVDLKKFTCKIDSCKTATCPHVKGLVKRS